MPLRISFPVALLLSLCLHAAVMVPGPWQGKPAKPERKPALEVQLTPPHETVTAADSISTETSEPPPPAPPAKPVMAKGRQLQRAHAALARHLLYPPEAVAQGLEGEVILLLVLNSVGSIESAEVARSSGHPLLDRAALAAARQIGALPGNPRQTLLPITFRLQ